MDYLLFTFGFTAIHIVIYTLAGVLVLRVPGVRAMYGGEGALFGAFLRDSEEPSEARRLGRLIVPAQILRGILMSLVLYPVLGALGDITSRCGSHSSAASSSSTQTSSAPSPLRTPLKDWYT